MTQKHVNTLTRTKNLVSEPVYIPYIIYMKNLRFSVRIPARIKRCDPDQTIICPHDSLIFYCWSACLLFNPFLSLFFFMFFFFFFFAAYLRKMFNLFFHLRLVSSLSEMFQSRFLHLQSRATQLYTLLCRSVSQLTTWSSFYFLSVCELFLIPYFVSFVLFLWQVFAARGFPIFVHFLMTWTKLSLLHQSV